MRLLQQAERPLMLVGGGVTSAGVHDLAVRLSEQYALPMITAYGRNDLHFSHPRTFLTPLDLGGLGFAFPVALGAKLGRPASPVLAIHGDGGFLMHAQEFETAVRHGINVVTLVMNNNCWGSGE